MSSYLVTGGCGFIGSHLCESLIAEGHRVEILDDLSTGKLENKPQQAGFHRGCITDQKLVGELIADLGVDGCFHLAAIASVPKCLDQWSWSHRVNLTGTINLFEAIRASGRTIPVVYASSAAIYGDCKEIPQKECSPTGPLTPYGADKYGCELHGRVAAKALGIPNVGLRFFNVYGPRQDPSSPYSGVISIFVERAVGRQVVRVFGDGCQRRDFIYVGDVVRALRTAMGHPCGNTGEVFNVCTGRGVTLLDMVKVLEEIVGHNIFVEHTQARPGDIRLSWGDHRRAEKLLGFRSEVELIDGLRSLIDWNRRGQAMVA